MMTRNADVLFMTEYIKNVLYFATVRQGKVLKSTADVHYFCVDNELVYENYYNDFGPLNLGCVYRYCKLLNETLKQHINKKTIVHYTSIDPKKKANAAFLIGCYGVLYLRLMPKDALKPLLIHGQSYRAFQDATQGDSNFTITLLDCLQAIKKARELNFFDFSDFNYDEYERLDKIQGGDLNWIIPGKFLAFIGPVDYSVNLYHPPEMYIHYFNENNVKVVIRLNKRMYDGNVFNVAGILHYDLFFPDGSCPPRHILLKFLQISEEVDGALAVHCKAGLGRTGSLIGSYLIKHYHLTAHEAIGWMRICRPGSVIGHQQGWLEQMEPWLLKQGKLYRKRTYQDVDKLPIHEYGVYSYAEKNQTVQKRPEVITRSRSPSPQPPLQGPVIRNETIQHIRPQASRGRDGTHDHRAAESDRSTGVSYASNKTTEKEQCERNVKSACKTKQSLCFPGSKGDETDAVAIKRWNRRTNGAGEPRYFQGFTSTNPLHTASQNNSARGSHFSTNSAKNQILYPPLPSFSTTQGPANKSLSDAKNFLLRNSLFKSQPETVKVYHNNPENTPFSYESRTLHNSYRTNNVVMEHIVGNRVTSQIYNPQSRDTSSPKTQNARRRLGRSPSPSPSNSPTRMMDHNRATNTSPHEKLFGHVHDSRAALKQALSRLKLPGPRNGSVGAASVGAASLGARRDAPAPRRAPSVRSDERPIATQGDMLNSIKFERRHRDALALEKINTLFTDKLGSAQLSASVKKEAPVKPPSSARTGENRQKERAIPKYYGHQQRPMSPKARMRSGSYPAGFL